MATVVAIPVSVTATHAWADKRPLGSAASEDQEALQKLLDALPAAGSPGAYAEVRRGSTVWKGVSGFSDLTANHKLTTTALEHRVGSVTKTFIATATLRLVEKHLLSLDGKVGQYLPGVLPADRADKITVRMLLNHTSGLPEYIEATMAKASLVDTIRKTTYAPRQIVDATLAMPAVGDPGEKFLYSNTNYHLLGMIIEKITGRSYEDAVDQLVLQPLHLKDTYFPGNDPAIRGPHAKGYFFFPDGTREDVTLSNHSYSGAAGALISTVKDLNTFYRELLAGKFLSGATMDQMLTAVKDESSPDDAYGLGISATETPCGSVWGHGGFAFGYQTYSLHSRDGSLNVSLGINRSSLFDWEPSPSDPAVMSAMVDFLSGALCPATSD